MSRTGAVPAEKPEEKPSAKGWTAGAIGRTLEEEATLRRAARAQPRSQVAILRFADIRALACVAALAFAALLGLAVVAATPAHANASIVWGLEQDGGMDVEATRTEQLDVQHALGARVTRLLLRYDQVARCDPTGPSGGGQPATSPTNPCYDFGLPDAVIAGAQARGMTVLLSIYGVPAWEFGSTVRYVGGTDAQFAAFSADYADFAQAAATRYDGASGHPRVTQWTIWNEPNGGAFFEPRFDTAGNLIGGTRYAHLYDAAARRIKAVDASLQVAVGPTAPMPPDLKPLVWARQVLPELQALGSPVDAWAHNGYMGTGSALHTYLKDPTVGLGNIGDLTATIDGFPVTKGKPIWITEFGYQTPPSTQSSVSAAEQSSLLADAAVFAYRQPRITTFIWYSLFDDGVPSDPRGFQSGLYYARGRCGQRLCPKPAAWAFQHTLWISPASNGKVMAWGQGRVTPAKTRIYVKLPGGTWKSYANTATAKTGTVSVVLKVTKGMQLMTCDTTCGIARGLDGSTAAVSGGGGTASTKQLLPAVKLGLAGALAHGIAFAVPCAGCKVTATVVAHGRASKVRAARSRDVVVATGRVRANKVRSNITLVFTKAARAEIGRASRSVLIIRTVVKQPSGATVVYDRPLTLAK